MPSAFAFSSQSTTENITNRTFLTCYNPDFGIKLEYPSGWKKVEDNLQFHTLVSFVLTYQNKSDFHNITGAEVDLRVYSLALDTTYANKLSINLINEKLKNETIINYGHVAIKAGLPGLAVLYSYHDGDAFIKGTELWTILSHRNALLEIIYITHKSSYYTYLPILEHIIESLTIY